MILISNPILESDLISVSNLILGSDKFSFSNKPVLEKGLSIQLYSRQWDEEVSDQIYHQHPVLHIVILMASVYIWCPL